MCFLPEVVNCTVEIYQAGEKLALQGKKSMILPEVNHEKINEDHVGSCAALYNDGMCPIQGICRKECSE